MQKINTNLLDRISEEAKQSPRLRMNYNFHESADSKAQRLLNALEPGTELPIHRHRLTAETYLVLRGRLKVMYYDDNGEWMEECILDPLVGEYVCHIPQGQWHTVEVLESGTTIFEVKNEPYTPLGE